MEAFIGKEWARVDRALVVGNGTSSLPAELRNRGVANVLAIDIAGDHVMDVRSLAGIADATMQLVFDKACIDELFCGIQTYRDVLRAHNAICRVMEVGGKFVSVTHGSPAARLPHLKLLPWTIEHTTLGNLHVYICTKTTGRLRVEDVGEEAEEASTEWERRKHEASATHMPDKWTPGHVRLAHVTYLDELTRQEDGLCIVSETHSEVVRRGERRCELVGLPRPERAKVRG